MISLQINDVKSFMNRLLLSDYFDAFYLSEAVFTTLCTFRIDGTLQKDYYTREEQEELHLEKQTCALWKQVRPFCLDLIKGKHTPLDFKIVFRLSPSNTEKLLRQAGLSMTAGDINGLFLNIRFQTGSLTCTTGTSLSMFTLDKTLDSLWDKMIQKYLIDFVSTHLD